MDVVVAVDPYLELDAAAFVAGWNESDAYHQLAEARLERQRPAGFPLDPALVEQGLIFLGGAASGLALKALETAVSEWVKELMKRRREQQPAGEPRSIVQKLRQPDGAVLLVVTEKAR